MPTFEVRVNTPVFISATVEANTGWQAQEEGAELLREWAAALTAEDFTATRQPSVAD